MSSTTPPDNIILPNKPPSNMIEHFAKFSITPGRRFRTPDPAGFCRKDAGKSPDPAGKHQKSLEHGSSIPAGFFPVDS
jgi:hypothetical protein